MKKLLILVTAGFLAVNVNYAINPPKFKYGLGGGVNFSSIADKNNYPLYEDISGQQYFSEYSGLFSNLGSQYFFHGEFVFQNLVFALKPGLYSFNFSKSDDVVFNNETNRFTSNYLLRYINIPLEAKLLLGVDKIKPYIGGEISYGYLLRQGGDAVNSFIHSRFSAGPVIGAYFSLQNFDIVFNAGYDIGLHQISSRDNRYNTSGNTPYSLGDVKLHNLHFSLSVLFALEKSNFRKSLECPKIQRK